MYKLVPCEREHKIIGGLVRDFKSNPVNSTISSFNERGDRSREDRDGQGIVGVGRGAGDTTHDCPFPRGALPHTQ